MSISKWRKPVNTFLATTMVASVVVVPAVPAATNAETVATDLIISEYIEGSSYNKAIEIYNGTGASVDLSNYTLELHSNGAADAANKLTLSGILENGKVYVLYHKDANASIKEKGNMENSSVINFNGNDPVVLKKDGQIIDSIGQVGSSEDFGKDRTLVRNSSVFAGDTEINDAFDTTSWDSFEKDDTTNLGSHNMNVSPSEPQEEDPDIEEPVDPGEEIPEPEEPEEPEVEEPRIEDPVTSEIITIADAHSKVAGEEVTIKGIVTAGLKNTFSVEDNTGGIAVRPTSLDLKVGEEVTLKGKLVNYRGLLQLDPASIVEKGEYVGAPNSKLVTGAQINESLESQLVTVKNVTLNSVTGSGWKNYTAFDGTTFIVRDEIGNLNSLEVGKTYESITGIVQQFDTDYQIIPRDQSDIVEDSSKVTQAIANPNSGTYVGKQSVILTTTTANAEIYYTLDGQEPTVSSTKYTGPIEITADTILKAIVKGEDGTLSEVSTFDYKITDSLQIHDIQGESHTSPFKGEGVNVQGVVTYTYKIGGGNYFHLQTPDELKDDNPNTSEGIIVYTGNKSTPSIGDLVIVTGTVDEYHIDGYNDTKQETDLAVTQINARDDRGGIVNIVESDVKLPAATTIDASNLPSGVIDNDGLKEFDPAEDAIDFWESLEGMRVKVGTVKAVAPQEHGDLITVLEDRATNTIHGGVKLTSETANPDRIQFKLYDNNAARNFEVATGDKFEGPIEGVVNYGFQNYKIYADYEYMQGKHKKGTAKPETTIIEKEDGKLTIGSYNLENFSNNTKETTNDKAQKLARAIAKDMQGPDIIGVTEVQDNNGSSIGDSKADQSYQRLIAEIEKAGGPTYKYLNIDPANNQDGGAPNANIRVGFLYNPERVTLPEGISTGDAITAVGYQDGKLTHNPGRINPTNAAFEDSRKPLAAQFTFQGEDVIVIANHWNSKSGDTPLFGSTQPPVYGSEEQRHKIANVVYDFVEEINKDNPDANIVSVGDFNDYQFSESLKIHEGNLMTNMINKVEDEDRYTYLFQGNSQVLDHILVSNNLAKNTKIDILHINADFTDMAGRASDHDPVMVQIDLKAKDTEEEVTPVTAEKVYNFTNFKTKNLIISKPSVELNLVGQSEVTNGVILKSNTAILKGEGFKSTTVTVKPIEVGAIIDLQGTEIQKLIIDGTHVKEIRGAENVEVIEYVNGASKDQIKFIDSKGGPVAGPSLPSENIAPVVSKVIENQLVLAGEELTIDLSKHFSDRDGDDLTFATTKGTVKGNILSLQLAEGSHTISVTATDGEKSVTAQFTVSVSLSEESTADPYYEAAYGKSGAALKTALHEIIDDHKQLSYDEVWNALKETDEDPNNPNNVILFYSGKSSPKNNNGGNTTQWNREHTWAKSHGDFGTSKGPGTDIHHLRPTNVQVNSSRGNLDFDNGGSTVSGCNGCYKDGDSFEPPNRVKGDVARILFYMATRYEPGDRVDLELNEKVNNGKNPYHGKLSVLLQWHKQDPVDAFEENRNDVIQKWQGNRNPFIDHPEWAEMIWK